MCVENIHVYDEADNSKINYEHRRRVVLTRYSASQRSNANHRTLKSDIVLMRGIFVLLVTT